MITIPYSQYIEFLTTVAPKRGLLRLGQAYHTFAQLHKCVDDKEWCDKLYNAPDNVAHKLMKGRIDYEN